MIARLRQPTGRVRIYDVGPGFHESVVLRVWADFSGLGNNDDAFKVICMITGRIVNDCGTNQHIQDVAGKDVTYSNWNPEDNDILAAYEGDADAAMDVIERMVEWEREDWEGCECNIRTDFDFDSRHLDA